MKPGSLITSLQDVRELTGQPKSMFLLMLAEVLLRSFRESILLTTNVKHTNHIRPQAQSKQRHLLYIRQDIIYMKVYYNR